MKYFIRSSSVDQRFRGLPGFGFGVGVGLVAASFHSLFFLLACPFVSRVISFIYTVPVRGGGVSIFNVTALSVFVRERLLPCRVVVGSMGCIVYTDYVYLAVR